MINRQDPLLATVVGYRLRHGEWPKRLRVGGALRRSPLHDAIAARIALNPPQGSTWVAEGDDGRQYKFDENELVPSSTRSRGLVERWLATKRDGGPEPIPSLWLQRQFTAALDRTTLLKPMLRSLAEQRITTIKEVACRSSRDLTEVAGVSSRTLLQLGAALYDVGLGFGMKIEETEAGTIVLESGIEPTALFPQSNFEAVTADGATMPSRCGAALVVQQALNAEDAALAASVLAVRPPLPGTAELERVLHEPLAHRARRSRMGAPRFVEYVSRRVAAYRVVMNGGRSTWLEEVQDALAGLPRDELEAGCHYYGIGRELCDTYAEVGGRTGANESSAYQLVKAFEEIVKAMRPVLPVCRATFSPLERFKKPVWIEQWWEAVPASIRPPSARDLASMASLDAWGWIRPISVWHCLDTYVAGVDDDAACKFASDVRCVMRQLRRWGAARVDRVAQRAHLTAAQVRAAFERDRRWLSASDEWFVTPSGGVLGRTLRSALCGRRPRTLAGLRRSLVGVRDTELVHYGAEIPPFEVVRMLLVLRRAEVAADGRFMPMPQTVIAHENTNSECW